MGTKYMHKPSDASDFMERFEIPDLNTAYEIQQALSRQDDAMLWEAAKRAECQQVFYEQLRAQVGTLSYTGQINGLGTRRSEVLCSLVLVPVLLGAEDRELAADRAAVSKAVPAIRNWLEEWFEYTGRIAMYSCLFDYSEVCCWTPSIMRSSVQRLIDSTAIPELCAADHQFRLPEDAPTLAFFVAVIQRPMHEPSLPPLDPELDRVLQAKIAGAIQISSPKPRQPQVRVLTPAFATDAIGAGLDEWIAAVASEHGIGRWDVQHADQDVVLLHLHVGEQGTPPAVIPLRAHQLGLPGIEERLAKVSGFSLGSFGVPQ